MVVKVAQLLLHRLEVDQSVGPVGQMFQKCCAGSYFIWEIQLLGIIDKYRSKSLICKS